MGNVKVKIIAFEDFRCPFCEKFFTDTEPQIIKDYVDTGKGVLYYRQYQFLGPASVIAGSAAECANEQGKFWAFHDMVFSNQESLNEMSFIQYANALQLNLGDFQSCTQNPESLQAIQKDVEEGIALNIQGTPSLFINGKLYSGPITLSNLKTAIELSQ